MSSGVASEKIKKVEIQNLKTNFFFSCRLLSVRGEEKAGAEWGGEFFFMRAQLYIYCRV